MLSYCRACRCYSVPNAEQCEQCQSTKLEWRPAAGRATLISWAFDNMTGGADARLRPVVIAEFAEGPWWWGQLELRQHTSLGVGLGLTVGSEITSDGTVVPIFRLTRAGPA